MLVSLIGMLVIWCCSGVHHCTPACTVICPEEVRPETSHKEGAAPDVMDSPQVQPLHSELPQGLSGFDSCCQTTSNGFNLPSPTFLLHILLKYQELFPYISWQAGHNPKHT